MDLRRLTTVARRLVVPPHREVVRSNLCSGNVLAANGEFPLWRAYRLAARQSAQAPTRIEALARRAGMSTRTFQRSISDAADQRPAMGGIVSERLRLAQEHLRTHAAAPLDGRRGGMWIWSLERCAITSGNGSHRGRSNRRSFAGTKVRFEPTGLNMPDVMGSNGTVTPSCLVLRCGCAVRHVTSLPPLC